MNEATPPAGPPSSREPERAASYFLTTQWSVVTAAGEDSENARPALELLCGKYWPPLYAYIRRTGRSPEDSDELTQVFFARLLQTGSLARASPDRGRFRTFLLTSLKRFLISEWRRDQALRRGGGARKTFDTVDAEKAYLLEAATEATPETIFEKKWVALLLENVLARFRGEAERSGKLEQFRALEGFIWGNGEETYEILAENLGMTEGALRVAAHRFRQRWRELLREEIAQTVSTENEVEEEIRHLLRVMS